MAERRMISTGIYDSSVAWNLGEKNPGLKGLAAQRILEILIFLADDHGRGRYMPGLIRTRAFSSIPDVLKKIAIGEVETWLKQIEAEGSIRTYEVDGQKYFTLTGWPHYQRGHWRPKQSNIPPPPWEENNPAPEEEAADKSHIKSENKSTEKCTAEVVTEKKRIEEKGKEEQSTSRLVYLPGETEPRPIKDVIADPDVSDSVAVSAGCQDIPEVDEEYLKKQDHRRWREMAEQSEPDRPDNSGKGTPT